MSKVASALHDIDDEIPNCGEPTMSSTASVNSCSPLSTFEDDSTALLLSFPADLDADLLWQDVLKLENTAPQATTPTVVLHKEPQFVQSDGVVVDPSVNDNLRLGPLGASSSCPAISTRGAASTCRLLPKPPTTIENTSMARMTRTVVTHQNTSDESGQCSQQLSQSLVYTNATTSSSSPTPSRWASWDNLRMGIDASDLSNAEFLNKRRMRNRESMQRSRQRKRDEIQHMKGLVAQLEKQYETLCLHTKPVPKHEAISSIDVANSSVGEAGSKDDIDNVLKRQLCVENASLKAAIPHYSDWKAQLSEMLQSMPYVTTESSEFTGEFAILEQREAELTYLFRPLSDGDVTTMILENSRIVQEINKRLEDGDPTLHIDRAHILDWDVRRRLDGTVTEYLFTKRFPSDVSIYDILQKSWYNNARLERIRRIETDTLRSNVLQQVNSDAIVIGRDVRSNDDRSVFRTVYLLYKMETTLEMTNPDNPAGPKLSANGYTVGICSMNPEQPEKVAVLGVDKDKTLRWADIFATISFLNVIDPSTGEQFVEIRWVGKSNYKTEPLANRNMTDTVTTVLRWELAVLAPALNLVSLSLPSTSER